MRRVCQAHGEAALAHGYYTAKDEAHGELLDDDVDADLPARLLLDLGDADPQDA